MKFKKKFRLESPSSKVEPYSSCVLGSVNKKGKEEMRGSKEGMLCSQGRFIF